MERRTCLSATYWLGLALALVLGAVPFCALGIALGMLRSGHGSVAQHVVALAAWGVAGSMLAVVGLRRGERRLYG